MGPDRAHDAEFLDSPGERRSGNVTLLSRAAKVQIFAYSKKVLYLMHFHLAANDTRRARFEQLLTLRDTGQARSA